MEKEKPKDSPKETNKPDAKQMIPAGLISGFLNGLFGSGGGVLAVMFLRRMMGDERRAHASATLMILVMSVCSLTLYALNGHVDYESTWMFLPGGVAGAVAGTIFLKNIKGDALRRVFGAIIAISGVVMLLR